MKKTRKSYQRDPEAAKEAAKYDSPIPSRTYILEYLRERGRPESYNHLVDALELETDDEIYALKRRLRAMIRDGQLMTDRRKRYCLIDKLQLLAGRVIGHPDGYGFVALDSGGDDLFLSASQMRQVMHGDRVLVRENGTDKRGRPEGLIVEIIESNTMRVVGHFYQERGVNLVDPDNKRIAHSVLISPAHVGEAKPGQIVMAELIAQPTRRSPPTGKIIEVLGQAHDPGMEIEVAIRAHEIPFEWPDDVLNTINQLPEKVSPDDHQGRKDLTKIPFVTIDGEDAQDFDDAVYCEAKSNGGWRLMVAIADVSHYVKPEQPLDIEARSRGNSVYFPNRVVPMLPEILSNGLCSLKPNCERLAMVCDMSISAEGKLTRYRFYPAVIHSHARLTYTKVAKIVVDKDNSERATYKNLVEHLDNLYQLYHLLFATRQTRGALDFDTVETRIMFDDNQKISAIVPVYRNDAHRIIEECMLMANIAAARFLQKNKLPSLYRVHSVPPKEKLDGVRRFLSELGLQLRGGSKPRPLDYARLIHAVADRDDAPLIRRILLYSLSQAEYSPDNIGHFGLAYPAYAHFTSPIRRYPDLLVHRAIRHIAEHQTNNDFNYTQQDMEQFASHLSVTERRADEATRDAVAALKCDYMLEHVGEVFAGSISGVTHFGLFVELDDIYVEGLVHITALSNDYYRYDALGHRLMGERTHKTYRLNDDIIIRVMEVNVADRKITFALANEDELRDG